MCFLASYIPIQGQIIDMFLKEKGEGGNPAPVKAPKRVVREYDPEHNTFAFIITGGDAFFFCH